MKPLADLLRPNKLEDVVGQKHLLNEHSSFYKIIKSNKIPNMLFYGPPGVGKTTVANIIANSSKMKLFKLNGTSATIEDIKAIIAEKDNLLNTNGILLYLDEIQYLNKKQQQSLLEFIENGDITLIASTTENPFFYVYPAILSRVNVFEFKAIPVDEIKIALKRIIDNSYLTIDDESLSKLATLANGDMRKAINNLELLLSSKNEESNITMKDIENLSIKTNLSYDRGEDKHFDNLSAFMKSLRGSDPDAAIYYLAKLLEGGDILAASRRLLCSVNEDVGLAYPQLIPIVKACVDSALQLGMPEARLPLSNATILIATAPKSNSSYLAFAKAHEDIEKGKGINVPRAVQNTHCDGEDALIKGQNYKYPHDYPHHYVKQQYLPDDLKNQKYYIPQDNKFEKGLEAYWKDIKK